MTKILDAEDWLSVQVHPDDAYGLAHEGELGKTECWYILSAEEGAEIIYGHKAESKEALRELEEKDAVLAYVSQLPQTTYTVMQYKPLNQVNTPPFLVMIEKLQQVKP